ncbi:MAG: DUF167 domain-containing protein [Candidatus Omnitrophica bacterium]|nr:DUF167 domain-containing protein [Candidatus Omnitrophota bacterium]
MKILVKVKTGAREDGLIKTGDNQFSARVKQRPYKDEANSAVIKVLAEYFGVAKSCIELTKGHKSKQKTFQVMGVPQNLRSE